MILNVENIKNFKKLRNEEYLFFKTKFIYNTIHLDYSELSFDNVFRLAENGRIDGILKFQDILCTVNCLELFDYIIDTVHIPLTEEYIKKCHSILTEHSEVDKIYNKSGKFKDNCFSVKSFYESKQSNYNILENELCKIIKNIELNNNLNNKFDFYDIVKFRANLDAVKLFDYYNYRISHFLHLKLCLMNNIDIIMFNFYNMEYYEKLLKSNLEFMITYEEIYKLFKCLRDETNDTLKEIGFYNNNLENKLNKSLDTKLDTKLDEEQNILQSTIKLAKEITSNINNISKFLPNI